MQPALCVEANFGVGKLMPRVSVADDTRSALQRRLFIADRSTGTRFLVDTGADFSVMPVSRRDKLHRSEFCLYAANATSIPTYGKRLIQLDFGLRRPFRWPFILADVSKPILGTDFLSYFNLIVDVRHRRLLDGSTGLAVSGRISMDTMPQIRAVNGSNRYNALLQEFPGITRETLTPGRTPHNVEHCIETTGPPVVARARRLDPERLKAARLEFDFMLQQGLCRPSKSPWASPLHLVQKKNNDWRPCGDYRRLNDVTVPDRYPIPFLQDCAHYLHGKRIFSTVDLVRAYQQIPVREADVPKTAIITPFGLYEFPFMPFGLRNAAQTFQRFINEVTSGLDFCFTYIDDILIASRTPEEHLQHLRTLFGRLQQYGIRVNPAKCVLGEPAVNFLGHRIAEEGITPLPEKVKVINDFPEPETIKGLRRFLGMVNFYHRFLPNAAVLQAPLQRAISGHSKKSQQPVNWTDDMRKAFARLKRDLAAAALLVFPAPGATLSLQTDASDIAIGAVLQQEINGSMQPLSFFSRRLTSAQQNYSVYDRELLAVYAAVKHFRHMLEGQRFHIITDHKPLIYVFRQKPEQASPRQLRQLSFLSEFSTDLRHVAGDDNVVADALSRIDTITMPVIVELQDLAEAQQRDEELQRELRAPTTSLKLQKFALTDTNDIVYCDCSQNTVRPYVPQTLRKRIFSMVHGLSHPSGRVTRRMIGKRFVWPNMNQDIISWARSCLECQRSKIARHVHNEPQKIAVPDNRFEHVHIDIVGPLLPSRGYRYCLTMIDRFSRWPEAVPITEATADAVANAFFTHWIARFGAPRQITTDQGTQFESALFKALAQLVGSQRTRTTAYHPEANGLIERWHRSLKTAIMCHNTSKWTEVLPVVLLGLRTCIKEDIGASPAEMVYGTTLKVPGEFFPNEEMTSEPQIFIEGFRAHMRELKPAPAAHHIKNKTFIYKDLYTCSHVFLRIDAVRKPLEQPYSGPHRIIKRDSDRVFTIEQNGRHLTVSIDRIKPAYLATDGTDNQTTTSQQRTYAKTPGRDRKTVTFKDL